MIGRVLRQPHAMRTGRTALDETHVFCTDVEVGEAVKHIKEGLEAEGMGDLGGEIVTGKGGSAELEEKTIRFRAPFRGKRIMIPRPRLRCRRARLRRFRGIVLSRGGEVQSRRL
jgi:type III restriction enzyme